MTVMVGGREALVLTDVKERLTRDGFDEEKKRLKAWIGSTTTKKRIDESSTKGEDTLL